MRRGPQPAPASPAGRIRHVLATVLAAVALAAVMAPGAHAAGGSYTNADYFAYADRVVQRLDDTWSDANGYYRSGSYGLDSRYNASMLVIHATAAAHGHEGPARNDERGRAIAKALTESPPFFAGDRPSWNDPMFHTPGWLGSMSGGYDFMDKAFDPKIAEGLQIAWRARDVLGLPLPVADRIVNQIHRVAYGPFFRYPLVRLNQINWPAELYVYESLVTGNQKLLHLDFRRQVRRFVAGIRRPWLGSRADNATNLSPTYRFHYQINQSANSRRNLDSTEYANMTLHFLGFYNDALRAGMRPLPAGDIRLLRGWVQRALLGYWMHSGMLNWDTGLGFGRWMKIKTWAYAQQGLLSIADAPRFHNGPRYGRWAKELFDRGLEFYERQPEGTPGMFGVNVGRGAVDWRYATARVGANAARAVSTGLGRMTGAVPPPIHAFDPDIGRLAVSTPAYGTAVVAVNRGAFPYGGLELARLHDRDGDPIGGIGGRSPAAFGIVVRDKGGRRALVTQTGLRHSPRRPPIKITRSPRGPVTRLPPLRTRPPGGPFRVLEAVGSHKRGDLRATTRHRFTARSIEESWTIRRLRGRRPYSVHALFPSWGQRASVHAELRNGSVVALASDGAPVGEVPLRAVRRFHVISRHGSYTVTPLGNPSGVGSTTRVARQRSAPLAGPTLQLTVREGRAFKTVRLRARITPQ